MPNLTELTIKSLPEGLHMDARTPAFGIRVGKRRKTWIVLREPNRTKVTIGHFPDLSLSDARKKAMLALGAPAKTAQRPRLSFDEARTLFLQQDRWKDSTLRVLKSSLGHFSWKRTLDQISHEDVAAALDAVDGSSARAHALKDIRTFFNWCVPRYLDTSPCAGLKMERQPSRDRVLSAEELASVWKAAAEVGYPFGTIVQLLILTGQRKSEIGLLQWPQISKSEVHLPPEATKNGRAHSFPIGPLARSLLPKRSTGYVFKATGTKDPYNGYTYHLKQLQKASGTKGWTLHDLRRTFATNLAAAGTPIHVTEKLLNHVSGSLSGVAAIYNRHSYADEMRAAQEMWERSVTKLTGTRPPKNSEDNPAHAS